MVEPLVSNVRAVRGSTSEVSAPMDRWTPMKSPLAGPASDRARTNGGRLLILGDPRSGRRVARCLSNGTWSGLTVVGFIDAGHDGYRGRVGVGRQLAVHPQSDPVPVIGQVDRLSELVDRVGATDLVVALSGRPARRVRSRIEELRRSDVRVHWIPQGASRSGRSRPSTPPGGNSPPWPWRGDRIAKRALDLVGSAIGLLLLAPLFAAVALAILATTGRPIFYTQERVGQGGHLFRMFKFRSMKRDAEGATGPIWASNHDDRCTKVGAWLRHTNIDELPQLINVLIGEMSLVGPRPERPVFVEHFKDAMPDYDLRHAVPGGMTGWAQVHGWRGRTSLRKRIQYDLDYIERWSFWFDFKVLFMTVQHVFWRKTSWKPPKRRRRPVR
jgi:exopolysaccharide biosynthesis polyprenyl glycosylphosphotransferase